MSIVFNATTWHLSNWAFGAGDIALLAGAGRQAITWITSSARDNGLLDFLRTSSSDLKIRRGLIDPTALNKRWGKKLLLLQNGKATEKSTGSSTQSEIENIDRFTWIMTLVVVCLDVSVTDFALQKIVIELCLAIFEHPEDKTEYLIHEIPEHVKGWRSNACARMMLLRARAEWRKLEGVEEQQHLRGSMPDSESREVVRFLVWLLIDTKDTVNQFATSSSDVFCLACVAQEMGFDFLRTAHSSEGPQEGYLYVRLDSSAILDRRANQQVPRRYGMRIPLQYPQESVTLWPGTAMEAQRRRFVFRLGFQAASDLHWVVQSSPFGNHDLDPGLCVETDDLTPVDRINDNIYNVATTYLLRVTTRAVCYLSELVDSWHVSDTHEHSALLYHLGNKVSDRDTSYGHDEKHRVELQIFLLGYYYKALSSIIDDTQLQIKEGFGSWTYDDTQVFVMIRDVVKSRMNNATDPGDIKPKLMYFRYQIMKLVAFLYAGITLDQLDDLKHSAAGVHGKISVVTPGLLRDVSTLEKVSKFILLDTDPTCIPSNGRGIILAGKYERPSWKPFTDRSAIDLQQTLVVESEKDFTSHIEPAWDYDANTCLVAYRHHGRLVHRANPLEMEASILEWAVDKDPKPEYDVTKSLSRLYYSSHMMHQEKKFRHLRIGDCYDDRGAVVYSDGNPTVSLFMTSTFGKAKSCILEMHTHVFVDRALWTFKDYPWSEEFPGAIPVALQKQALLLLL